MQWKEIKLKDYRIVSSLYGAYHLIHTIDYFIGSYDEELLFSHYCRNNVVKFFHDFIVYGEHEAHNLNNYHAEWLV